MKDILPIIDQRKVQLEQTAFCRWLSSPHGPGEDPFAFTPSMAFFVLGFKDILAALKVENPTTLVEHQINTHCEEDLDHWKWYLGDLETLGFNFYSWGTTVTDIFKQVWSDEHSATRELVYRTIHFIRQSNPQVRFVILEVLEAAFGAFIKCMDAPIKRAKVYDKLDYFGRTHVEKEESHALGSWTGSDLPQFDESSLLIDEENCSSALFMINDLFNLFEVVFSGWFASRHSYTRQAGTPAAVSAPLITPSVESGAFL